MDVCVLWVLCVVRNRSLRRADHSSRVQPSVVRRCVWSRNVMSKDAMASVGPQRHRKQQASQCTYNVTLRCVRATIRRCAKAMSITYSESMSVALCIQHAMPMRHIVICALPRATIFFYIISWKARFSEKRKKLLNIKRVFWFSLQILSETFLILGRNERGMIKMYIGLHSCTN